MIQCILPVSALCQPRFHPWHASVTCLPHVEECYTLMLSDNDGDIVIENGCHDPGLNFTTACECTDSGGYICWSKCPESNRNSQVDLHPEMVTHCSLESDATTITLCAHCYYCCHYSTSYIIVTNPTMPFSHASGLVLILKAKRSPRIKERSAILAPFQL